MRELLRNEDGFTIQELVVILVIGSIMIAGVWTLYLFAEKSIGSWKRTTEFNEAASTILATMSADIAEASQGVTLTDSSLLLVKDRWGRSVNYTYQAGRVVRNRVPIYQPQGSTVGIRITVAEQGPSGEPLVLRLELEGESRSATFRRSASIMLPRSSMFSYVATRNGASPWAEESGR